MPAPRLRAVVLAAGHGLRLRPLTTARPKPLLPILGRPLLAWTLERLARSGVETTAINLHHLADAIPRALGDRFGTMPIVYSREEPILGTLGALYPLRDFLQPADLVLLVNGDSLCDWPFEALIERHRETRPLVTLLLSATADPTAFGGGVGVDAAGRIVAFPPDRLEAAAAPAAASPMRVDQADGDPGRHPAPRAPEAVARRVFAGAHVFAPALLDDLEPGSADSVRDLYRPRLAAGGRIESVTTAAAWNDLGTPGRYLDAILDWMPAHLDGVAGRGAGAAASWLSSSAVVDSGAALERTIVEAGAVIEAGSSAREVLVLERARVGRASRLERVIVGPGVELAAETRLEDALVTPRAWGRVAGSRDAGELVVTPLRSRPAS
jgi:mannose-1-phosphate guanylyltransferase